MASISNFIGFLALCFVAFLVFKLNTNSKEADHSKTQVSFKKIQLLDKYITEGASIEDINNDGHPDIIAGSLWWEGPEFKEKHAYAPVKYFPIVGPNLEGYSTNFFTFPADFNKDGWVDILQIGTPGTNSTWIKNPGKNDFNIEEKVMPPNSFPAIEQVGNESPNLIDIIGDEKKELLAVSKGRIVLGILKEDDTWQTLAISPYAPDRFPVYMHGLGAGDINMDGRIDILEKSAWWEQPEHWDQNTVWTYHPYPFAPEQGGAQMFAFDIDGDNDNDVVTAMNAHAYGLSWHEQIKTKGSIDFKEHQIMANKKEDNAAVSFSQLHALACADIDKDGVLDIITGKCYYAHNGRDPGAEDPAVLYWFKTQRNTDGSVDFIPNLIDEDSGVGRQISTGDLNDDGKVDLVIGNKKGVFAFIQI